MGSFVLRVEGDSLQMVSFRVKVWVTCIVILANGIFRSQSKRPAQLKRRIMDYTRTTLLKFPRTAGNEILFGLMIYTSFHFAEVSDEYGQDPA